MPTVQTNDIVTYYERRGSGHPIVFVHAAVLDHAQFDPQVEALADRYETIAYDVRGHGRTGGSARERYSIDLFADDLDALLSALDVARPVLCGVSTGGCVAQVYAARHPDRIAGLVLADTFEPEILDWREWLQRSLLMRATIPPVRLVGYERVERAVVWLQERFQGAAVSGDYGRVEELREKGPKMTTAEFAKVIRAVVGFAGESVDYGAVSVPTLVLYGEHEPGFVRRHVPRFAARLPDVTVVEVAGAGHASNLDAPERFTAALEPFLDRVAPREAAGGTEGDA